MSWTHAPVRRPGARLRLYCVPYAGSGSAVFQAWPRELPAQVELRTILLPGRERRFTEPAVPSVSTLADRIVQAVLPGLDPPYAIFGHSLGAMVAYEMAVRLTAHGVPPVCLLPSGARAPHLPNPGPVRHKMPDAVFVEEIRGLGGTPPELLADKELLELVLPTLRTDFAAAETYLRPDRSPLPCPITAFCGADDPLVTEERVAAWSEHTTSGFHMHVLPGDHFFLATARPALLHLIAEELEPHLS